MKATKRNCCECEEAFTVVKLSSLSLFSPQWRAASQRCSSVEMCFHLGVQWFSVCEVKSSHCARPASTSWASWPVTVTISRHLPIKAAHFLRSCPCDSLPGRAMTGPCLLIGHFPANIPEWLTSSLGVPQCDFSHSTCGQFWDWPHLCNFDPFYFFTFLLLFFSPLMQGLCLDPESRKQFIELGDVPRAEQLCQHVYVWVLTYFGKGRQQSFVISALNKGKSVSKLQIYKCLNQYFSKIPIISFPCALFVILKE